VLLIAFVLVMIGVFDPQQYPFPKCPFRSLTGWLCPGCGSQRAMHQLLHGQVVESLRLNLLLLPALMYGLMGVIISYASPHQWPGIRMKWYGINAAWVAVGIIVVYWVGRNVI
jgi:hypothetical protein